MSIGSAMIEESATMVRMFESVNLYKINKGYSNILNPYKASSTKKGYNPKAIKARRKKNKNKKTHRK